jgi:hypothetical protein
MKEMLLSSWTWFRISSKNEYAEINSAWQSRLESCGVEILRQKNKIKYSLGGTFLSKRTEAHRTFISVCFFIFKCFSMFKWGNPDAIIEAIKIFNITILLGLILQALDLLPDTGFIVWFLAISLLWNAIYANHIEKKKTGR